MKRTTILQKLRSNARALRELSRELRAVEGPKVPLSLLIRSLQLIADNKRFRAALDESQPRKSTP